MFLREFWAQRGLLAAAVMLAACFLSGNVGADVAVEAGLTSGFTNNLLSEASGYDDSYSTAVLTGKAYPLPQVQLTAGVDYTYYGNLYSLSNHVFRGGLVWIPTAASSTLPVYVEGNFTSRHYRAAFEQFDTNEGLLKGTVGYRIAERIRVRAGANAITTVYTHDDDAGDTDYEQYEFFGGVNITLPGANSFDLEAGVGFTRYAFIDASADSVIPATDPIFHPSEQASPDEFLRDGDFRALYVSPRFSRSIGTKTGVSITYTYRRFAGTENSVLIGVSTADFLSPWSSFFDGSSVLFRAKTYVVPHMVISGGVGYWDKSFLKMIEQGSREIVIIPEINYSIVVPWWGDPKDAPTRTDDMTKVYVSVQRPIQLFSGRVLEPSLGLEYIRNSSSEESYDYSTTAVSLGIVFRL